jgi:cytidyltransferase-like protein
MSDAVVTGSFDDLRCPQVRFLEEASKLGKLQVQVWSDETIRNLEGKPPQFPLAERLYFVRAIRYVTQVSVVEGSIERDAIPHIAGPQSMTWVVDEPNDTATKRSACESHGMTYRVLTAADLQGFPAKAYDPTVISARKKVVVTGCYDWFHSGHVRFFEEVSELGDLYVVAGHDENVRLLKGAGHPLFPQDERRYMAQSIRYVTQALISSGQGWMDAEPEIDLIKPDMYAVNEDGDKPEKREFCQQHGIQYVVLKRTPKPGLPRRQSTDLRGF